MRRPGTGSGTARPTPSARSRRRPWGSAALTRMASREEAARLGAAGAGVGVGFLVLESGRCFGEIGRAHV